MENNINEIKGTVQGIGYNGIGKYSKKYNEQLYKCWQAMLIRCYDKKYHDKNITYIGCSVDERWHNLQNFGEWYELNYFTDYHLDKDILFKGNKIYSPETCCFVPTQINSLFKKNKNNLTRNNIPIGLRLHGNNYQVSVKKFSKHLTFGTYKTIQEAFNVYKIEKEKYIKEVAEIWKDKISEKVYQALINYNVEITD